MLVRASKFLAVLFLLQLLLAGCSSSRGIFVTLLLDYSDSNIAVNSNSKVPQKICRDIVLELRQGDYFTVGKFDSVFPNPQSLRQVNKISTRKAREDFAKRQCPNFFRKSPDLNHPNGTDVYTAWATFYQAYEERHKEAVEEDKGYEDNEYTEVVFFVIDALEKADQGKEHIDFTSFKGSISRFVGDGNKIVFFINRERDRDSLASKLLLQGIEIHPYDENFQSTVKSTYSAARAASSIKTSN
jgi:hypothetical protein